MLTVAGIASCLQVGGGGGGAASHGLLDCLGLLLARVLPPILSFCILKARSALKRTGPAKPDFTSLRSTGKTIVNAAPDEDDTDQFGGVN